MISENIAKQFIGRDIGFVRKENRRDVFTVGLLTEIKDNCLIIQFHGQLQVHDLSSVIAIKQLKGMQEVGKNANGRDVNIPSSNI